MKKISTMVRLKRYSCRVTFSANETLVFVTTGAGDCNGRLVRKGESPSELSSLLVARGCTPASQSSLLIPD